MVSIVVPTLGRFHEVRNLFTSLTNSNNKNFEVILVDQNKNLDLASIVEEFKNHFKIKHLKVNFTGVSLARNFGIDHVDYPIVCTPDDDCEFLPDTLDNGINNLAEVDIVFGRCIDREGKDSVSKFAKKEVELSLNKIRGYAIEATMFCRTNVFSKVKYNCNLGVGTFYGSDEVIDLIINAIKSGYSVKYTPYLLIFHPQIQHFTSQDGLRRGFMYSCGTGRVSKLHKSERLNFIISLVNYFSASLFFLLMFNLVKSKYYFSRLLGLLVGYLI